MANIKISELNELETKHKNDLLPIVNSSNNETEKIKVENLINENVKLIAVSSTAPSGCSIGDKYFNTTSKKIYTAIATNTWSSTGENAVEGILYIVFSERSTYAYNGTTLINIGGSGNYSGLDGKPSINGNTLNGNKTNAELGIPNVLDGYSSSTKDAYSCNYINGIVKSGSNSNGNYTKFSDGTLICWGQTGNITSNSHTGVDNTYTLPHAFKDTKYYINTNFITGSSYFADVACFAKPKTTSQFQLSTYNNGGGSNTTDYQWLAIGRWK